LQAFEVAHQAVLDMAKCKIGFEHRERALNHTMGKLDRIYNQHDFDDEKQIALETLERKLKSIITGSESKVIPISAGKKAA
jgi:polyisoprenoid-binding protein YceI